MMTTRGVRTGGGPAPRRTGTGATMKILFAFENALPSTEADAEVFVTTARYLGRQASQAWLHVPMRDKAGCPTLAGTTGLSPLRAWAPVRPALARHVFCGLTLVWRRAFRQADFVYTRNLWIAWMAILFGQQVVFDHYRPWPDQIPPLRRWLHRLMCNPRFLLNICHSDYTRRTYLDLDVPADKLRCIRNGFEPDRLQAPVAMDDAKRAVGIPPDRRTVVYTGRVNHKKGLPLVIEAARALPDLLFVLVGSYGHGPIEDMARSVPNVRIVPFQPPETLTRYIHAADVLLIPPSLQPLARYGSTVLPLKLFFYMASGRPILAGNTPDVREVLRHGENAFLCAPDSPRALIDGLAALTADPALSARLAATALAESVDLTWAARARHITAAIQNRLAAPPAPPQAWGRAQYRAWLRQSWRWLAHLARTGSLVLPPDLSGT
ncbi:glycosyltransferase family 4 protein [Gluconacetobacter azotocaptans]|uniref:glycosyltransferase family 4 protein n=1 Tax=Gluconacetobacter azotocaptans TaxID=142834 RepID=UPI001F045C41|nr:glycosyltransferase family 4 protein [Gluconacetobacter azotocaptans]